MRWMPERLNVLIKWGEGPHICAMAAIPFALEKVILKCLECDPEKRYPYMSVLVRDLQSTLYV